MLIPWDFYRFDRTALKVYSFYLETMNKVTWIDLFKQLGPRFWQTIIGRHLRKTETTRILKSSPRLYYKNLANNTDTRV